MGSASGYGLICCPECPSTLSVDPRMNGPYRLTHHADGSHTAQYAPADATSIHKQEES